MQTNDLDWVVDEFCNSASEFTPRQLQRIMEALAWRFGWEADAED